MTSSSQPLGFLAVPTVEADRAVLVLHPWWGLNTTIKTFCERLANAGLLVFAPDLYHGQVTDQIAEAEKLVTALDANRARADITQAVAFLKERAKTATLAVIGFSMGAYYALELSTTDPASIDSVVVFYGTGEGAFSNATADYLFHLAEQDDYEPQEFVDGMLTALRSAGRSVTVYTYPETGHWFFEPDRVDVYNEAAATLAWERTLAFLQRG